MALSSNQSSNIALYSEDSNKYNSDNITTIENKEINENLNQNDSDEEQKESISSLKKTLENQSASKDIREGLKNLVINQFQPSIFTRERINSTSYEKKSEIENEKKNIEVSPLPYNPKPNSRETIIVSRNVYRKSVTITHIPIEKEEKCKSCCKCYISSHRIFCFCFSWTCNCYTCSKCCGKAYLTADI